MNHKFLLPLCAAIFSLASASLFRAADAGDIVIGKKLAIHSDVLGEDRRVYVHTPDGYEDGDEKYPVLYVLDGMSYFQMAVGVLRYHAMFYVLPKMIVVGMPNPNRNRDMTPTSSNIYKGKEVDWLKGTGGADNMLRFMREELFPHIEAHYRTQPFRVIAGHSFGALFAVHALLSQPDLFNACIGISTSFWFDGNVVTRRAESAPQPARFANRFLYLSVGGGEEAMQLNGNNEFVDFLREKRPPGLIWTFDYLREEDHGSQGVRAMLNGLRFIYSGWKQPPGESEAGLAAVLGHFGRLSETYGYAVPVPKDLLVNGGYYMLARERHQAAIDFFRYYASEFPGDPNAFDCLGESHERAGQLRPALENYEKACRIAAAKKDPRLETFEANRARTKDSLEKQGK